MKFYSLIFLLIVSFNVTAQKKFISEDLTSSEISLSELSTGMVYRELSHAQIKYDGDERFKFFDPDGNVIKPIEFCSGAGCFSNGTIEDGIQVTSGILGGGPILDNPLGFLFNMSQIKTGEYTISVLRPDNTPKHVRKFKVVNDEPRNLKLSFIENNQNTTDTLTVSKNKPWKRMKLKIDGDNIDQKFQSVTIQGLELIQDENDLRSYSFSKTWNLENANLLELGESSVVFKREYASKPTAKSIFVNAPQPKILGQTLEFQIEEGQANKEITLQVKDIYKGAIIKLAETGYSRGLFEGDFFRTGTIDENKGTITFNLIFKPFATNVASFDIAIINADQRSSDFKTIRLVKKSTTVKASAVDSRRPLVSGINNIVRFERLNGLPFNSNDHSRYTVEFNNSQPIEIEGERIGLDAFIATVFIPENLPSETIGFTLKNAQGQSWNGEIASIRKKPELSAIPKVIFKGSEVTLFVESAKDVFLQNTSQLVTVSTPENSSSKEFNLTISPNAEDFKLILKLMDHEIQTLSFNVEEYPNPKNLKTEDIVRGELIKNDRVILNPDNKLLELKIPLDKLKTNANYNFYAQVYKNDGTSLGTKKMFLVDNDASQMSVTINTRIGLSPGDEFDILITNPNEQEKSISSYIKREFSDQVIITAGLSAIDYKVKENKEENQARVLDGVNIGVYFMPENLKNPATRLVGFGPNILLTSNNDKIQVRGAASLIFLEKVVLGLSFGKGGAGFLAGINIELADFTSLLGQ